MCVVISHAIISEMHATHQDPNDMEEVILIRSLMIGEETQSALRQPSQLTTLIKGLPLFRYTPSCLGLSTCYNIFKSIVTQLNTSLASVEDRRHLPYWEGEAESLIGPEAQFYHDVFFGSLNRSDMGNADNAN